MYQRRRARILLAVLVLVSLVLVTVDFRSEDGPLDGLRGLATTVFGPLQDGVVSVVRPIGDVFGGIGDVFRVRSENERLQARVEQLEERRESFADLQRQNEELRGLLDMQARTGFDDVVVARTVALAPSNFEWTITLDVGARDGIAENMPVINGDGLVGRVIQVTPNASRVLLAIDPNFSASARLAANGEVGAIDGRGSDPLLFRPLDPEAEIAVGDEIVTNAYQFGLFPPGIPIGAVERVGQETTLLSREVLVRPFVDFTRLDRVLVVRHDPTDEPPPIPTQPQRPLVPPNLVPTPTPTPAPTPDATAEPTEGET
ncbi:MAG: rod shape-determining protein MreC [Actinomycetes bacterium]